MALHRGYEVERWRWCGLESSSQRSFATSTLLFFIKHMACTSRKPDCADQCPNHPLPRRDEESGPWNGQRGASRTSKAQLQQPGRKESPLINARGTAWLAWAAAGNSMAGMGRRSRSRGPRTSRHHKRGPRNVDMGYGQRQLAREKHLQSTPHKHAGCTPNSDLKTVWVSGYRAALKAAPGNHNLRRERAATR